jgi:hypothetical protein
MVKQEIHMMDTELLTDTVSEWFQTLNYEYMLLHIIICYGLYYSKNMGWIVQIFSPIRKKGISRGVWLAGGLLAAVEIIRFGAFALESGMSYTQAVDRFISIFHSYVVVQVFVDPIVQAVHKWLNIIRNTTEDKLK